MKMNKLYLSIFLLNISIILCANIDSAENENVVAMTTEGNDDLLSTIPPNIDENSQTTKDVSTTNVSENCGSYETCQDCNQNNCTWIQCGSLASICSDAPDEMCPRVGCDITTTTSPKPTTEPTTPSMAPDTTTTAPDPTTTETPATTQTTSTSTTEAPTTSSPPTTTDDTTTEVPTTVPPTKPTTTAPVPPTTATPAHGRHFDAASFFGGILLAVTLIIGGFFALKYYKKRSLAPNYSNF